jgi:hypothetical protein
MKTRKELKQHFDLMLNLNEKSTLMNDEMKNQLISDAYIWVGNRHKWASREVCERYIIGTEAREGYYDYPAEFPSKAIETLRINGKLYDQRDYHDLMRFMDENPKWQPQGNDKPLFANYGSWFFIFPIIKVDGLPMHITGVAQVMPLVNDQAKTIWSEGEEDLNEAIVLKALHAYTRKQDYYQEAMGLVEACWDRYTKELQKDKKLDRPLFNVPDFFR